MNKIISIFVGLFIAFIFIIDSFYILDQRTTALVLQLGKSVDYITEPGLKFKLPLIQNVIFFDKRIQNLVADTSEVIASDQKTMRVDAFTKYRIINGLKFYQTAKDDKGFKLRLAPILDSSLRQVLGSVAFITLLTPERTIIMQRIKEILNKQALDFGVEIVDVRIMRADLPDRSRDAVYERMRSDREKEAREIRAEGFEASKRITSGADMEAQVIFAKAKQIAEITRGDGDAEAIKIFAVTFSQDPEFFDFYRSLQAYKASFKKENTRIIISTESEFLKYFKKS